MTDAAAVIIDPLDPRDQDALERCLQLRLADPERRQRIERMLAADGWLRTAKFCSYSLQRRNLRLKPWQAAPCMVREHDPRDADGRELAEQLIRAGLSQYEPDPVRALAELEKPKRR
jgi:hypothetical protein